jgi:hypothetical protein
VAVDTATGYIEIQSFDGDVEEVETGRVASDGYRNG